MIVDELDEYLAVLENSGWTARSRVMRGSRDDALTLVDNPNLGEGKAQVVDWFSGVGGLGPGSTQLGKLWMFPLFVPLSLHDAREAYWGLLAAGVWNSSWFPILEDQAGWFYAIDTGEARGPVIFAQLDMGGTPRVYESVSDMILTHRTAVEEKVITFGASGEMLYDEEEVAVVAKRLNPSIEWWR